eukprot:6843565-Prorocentrum_lima.AAC.1
MASIHCSFSYPSIFIKDPGLIASTAISSLTYVGKSSTLPGNPHRIVPDSSDTSASCPVLSTEPPS